MKSGNNRIIIVKPTKAISVIEGTDSQKPIIEPVPPQEHWFIKLLNFLISALKNLQVVLILFVMIVAQSGCIQAQTQDSVWIKIPYSEWQDNDVNQTSFAGIVSLISNIFGVIENATDKKDYTPMDAVKTSRLKRREFIKLQRQYSRGKIMTNEYLLLLKELSDIEVQPE